MPVLPTVATTVVPLLQVPPVVALVSVVVAPAHTLVAPDIVAGIVLTVTTVVARQPVINVYVILVVPAVRPVSMPDVAPIEATDGLLLVHDDPPLVASV
jgi:hypothetical protein